MQWLFKFDLEFSLFLAFSIGCEPNLKNSVLQGGDKCVHVGGEYLEKTAKTIY
jgi:hypothetical protein